MTRFFGFSVATKRLKRLEEKEINMDKIKILESILEISGNQVDLAKEVAEMSENLGKIARIMGNLEDRISILETHMLKGKN